MAKKIYAAFTEPKPISELPITTTLEPGNMLLEATDGSAKRISTEVFYQLLHKIAVPITPADAGPFTANTWYKPMTYSADPGTNYPNAGNQKAIEGYDTLFFYTGTAWQKYFNKLPQAKIDTWSAVGYFAGKQVFHEGKIYESTEAVLSTDTPGVSAKWAEKVGNFELGSDSDFFNKVADKSMSPAQLFKVIGDFEFSGQIIQLNQQLPYNGFTLSAANSSIPEGYWSYADDMYSEFDRITAIDLKMVQGTFNIYVFEKNNYSNPSQTIPVTAASAGIHRHIFANAINPDTHKVFIGVGFYYTTNAGPTGCVNINSGTLSSNPTISPGMLLIGEKDVVNTSGSIVNRLESLENQRKTFSNYLYRKSGAAISDITADTGGGTFSLSTAGLSLNSTGVLSGVTLNKQINLSQRYLELKLKLYTDTVMYVGTRNIETTPGENQVELDCASKTLRIKAVFGGNDIVKNFSFNIVNGREYILRYYKLDEKDRLEIIDTISAESEFVEMVTLGQFDKYKFGRLSGSNPVVISEISIVSLLKDRPYIGFYGDSITEGNIVGAVNKTPYYRDRFANLIGEKLGKPYFVSARSAGGILGVLARIQTELLALLPKYIFVTVGTNGNNTVANLNQLIDYCEGLGVKVILNLIPLYDGGTAGANAIIQNVVNARGLMCVQTNRATSVNGDGVTKDNSKFANEGGVYIHPNEAGNLAIYKRALIDIKSVFVEAGVF